MEAVYRVPTASSAIGWLEHRRALRHVLATGAVALTTVLGLLLHPHLAAADGVMLYLLAIGLVAYALGRAASVTASAISVLAFDYTFVEPRFTFAVNDERYLLTFAMMFVVGITLSALTQRLRRESAEVAAATLSARTESMRSALLSTVSHDLRTPLAVVQGAASTLRESGAALSADERDGLLASISEEAERLERLVSNLLEMTRLESGSLKPRLDWLPVEELVGSALERLEARLGSRAVETRILPDLPLLQGDPVLLEQVLINLLENALKYAPGRTPLSITAERRGDELVLAVGDRGPGLAPGTEARVFEKFFRDQRVGVAPGAGLGLAICKGIVEAHGGQVAAANREGGGAIFTVRLPVPKVQP